MKTIEIKLYSFEELSKEAQTKVLEKYSDINVDYDWWDSTYEDAERIGLKLTSFALDRNRHATGDFLLSAQEVAANIIRDHGDTCETYKTAQKYLDDSQEIENKYTDMEDPERENNLLERDDEFLKELLEDYSIILQGESEYLQSEEAIIETIKANEYTFEENGTMRNA